MIMIIIRLTITIVTLLAMILHLLLYWCFFVTDPSTITVKYLHSLLDTWNIPICMVN